MAIDDIVALEGTCPQDTRKELCDFEQGSSCVYEPIFSGNTNEWKIYQGRNMKPSQIPDHTTHTIDGHFYGMDLSLLTNSTVTTYLIETSKLPGNGPSAISCFKFSYYLESVSSNVTLFYGIKSPTTPVHGMWQVAGSTAGIWFRHFQSINIENEYFSIQMGINTNGQTKGKVLIDDVVFDQTSCDQPNFCNFEVSSKKNQTESQSLVFILNLIKIYIYIFILGRKFMHS